ncbi:MAG: preprotein translocase subunit SecE [Saprospiraceae bacterium]
MEGITLYIKESYNELVNKVTWPSWEQLQSNTTLVVIGSLILAGIIFIMDAIINSILDVIYQL